MRPLSPSQHNKAVAALCLCMFTHSYLMISVFPYSGYMAIQLIPSVNSENAGSYAGMIAAAFMLGRTITAYYWGILADRYGRLAVFYSSLSLSCILTLLFGMSKSFWLALTWRFLLGFCNGILMVARTSVSEIAFGDTERETRGTGIVLSMWGMGFLIGPAISGTVAQPIEQYPDWTWLQQSRFADFLSEYPFYIPNVIAAILCILSMLAVRMYIVETLPAHKIRPLKQLAKDVLKFVARSCTACCCCCRNCKDKGSTVPVEETPLLQKGKNYRSFAERVEELQDSMELTAVWDGTVTCTNEETKELNGQAISVVKVSTSLEQPGKYFPHNEEVLEHQASMSTLWQQINTRNHLIVYWFTSFVSTMVDETFPLFCLAEKGGLGLQESSIGLILSTSGLMFTLLQYFVFAAMTSWVGVYGTIHWGSVPLAPLIVLSPIAVFLNNSADENKLTLSAFLFLSVVTALFRIFSGVLTSSLVLGLNRSVEPGHRATLNGLVSLGESVTKGLAPIAAGFLATLCFSTSLIEPSYGAVLLFSAVGLLCCLTSTSAFLLLQERHFL